MIKVVKFGGSSVASAEQFKKIKNIIDSDSSRRIVVVSALGKRFSGDNKITDLLYLLSEHIRYGVDYSNIFSLIAGRYEEIKNELNLSIDISKEFDIIKEKLGVEPDKYFAQALENVKPLLETKARRVGGSNYQVPIEISPARQQTLAIRWLVTYARKRNEKSMEEKLANEIIDAYNSTGGAYKKKDDTHKMAESNKAFAHYRW